MEPRFLVDTDVLIDYLRGNSQAIAYLEPIVDEVAISVVTLAELYSGVREGKERSNLDFLMSLLKVIHVDRAIAFQAGTFRRTFRKSHRLGLPDALIAATAHSLGIHLVTLNRKDYPMFDHVIVPYQKS